MVILKTQNSYNSRVTSRLNYSFVPQRSQIILYSFLSLLLLILADSSRIWHKFSTSYLDQSSFSEAVHESHPGFISFLDHIQSGRLPMIVFWALVGCSIYILGWFIWTLLSNIRNDLIADSYAVGGDPSKRRIVIESILYRKFMLVVSIVALIFYAYLGIRFFSVIADYFYTGIDNFKFDSGIKLLVSIALVSLLLYAFTVMLHLSAKLWMSIYRNL